MYTEVKILMMDSVASFLDRQYSGFKKILKKEISFSISS